MNKDINLLIPEHENTSRKQQLRILRIVSLSFMFVILFLSVGMFFLILASPLPPLRQEENQLTQQLNALRGKSGRLFLIKERLGNIEAILKKRPAFDSLISQITAPVPSDAQVEALEIEANKVTVTITSSSLLSLRSYLETMKQLKENEKLFKSVTLSSISYDEQDPIYKVKVSSAL